MDEFLVDRDKKTERLHSATLASGLEFDESKYEFDDSFIPARNKHEIHTTAELIHFAENDPTIEIDAQVISKGKEGLAFTKLNKEKFIETFKRNDSSQDKLREAFREGSDSFLTDDIPASAGLVGDDFIPLLGGPFNKQLYYYDYLRMHAISFHAYHHDPFAKRIVNTIVDFTLGRGWRVDFKNKTALAIWRATEEVNDLYTMMNYLAKEFSIYGETMIWELPNDDTFIQDHVRPGQEPTKGLIPRFRLIDPSVIWEIITYPEDINRVLSYRWVAPTQYQIYPGMDQGEMVTTTKFIYRDIPADQVMHFKTNCVSNEKRGRSDLFPALGYLKRLRDSINYSIIGDQKASAWSIDTVVEGSQTDIDAYIQAMQDQGTIAPAGSEFVHTSKIKRDYLGNHAGGSGKSASFEWCLSAIATATGIPINYFCTHLSNQSTRASAVVATTPVDRLFQMRQLVYEKIILAIGKRVLEKFGIDFEDAGMEVTFPEIVTQDRSAKLKDLALAEQQKWLSTERCATIAAKEFGITDYEYSEEKQKIADEPPPPPDPLTGPGAAGDGSGFNHAPMAMAGEERHDISTNDGF